MATTPTFTKKGFRFDPYNTYESIKLDLATTADFDKANYAFASAAGCSLPSGRCSLQEVSGSRVYRRSVIPGEAPVCDAREPCATYSDLFIGGLPYLFDMGILVQLFRDATGGLPVVDIETIPGLGRQMPTSCRITVRAEDAPVFLQLDKHAIVVSAGLLVIPQEAGRTYELLLEKRNNLLDAERAALGLGRRAALRPLVVQLRQGNRQ